MLQKNAVDQKVLGLIKKIQSISYMSGFHLVGGTALAIYINHRKSYDIDLFNITSFDEQSLLENLTLDLGFHLNFASKNTLKGSIDGIKTDILSHRYPLIEPVIIKDGLLLQSIPDITAMKLNAISINGQRIKDFIDIYFLLEQFTLHEMLDFYRMKYTLQNDALVLKSLTWFEDVDTADWPEIIAEPGLTWQKVKKRLIQSMKEF
jgi:hypothetical protein